MTRTGGPVLAHAFGERYELPLPLWLFVVGGALVVVASFALTQLRTSAPRTDFRDAPDVVPARSPRLLPGVLSTAFLLFVCVVGLTGTQETSYNVAPLYFWVFFWIAVPLSCGLLGDWTGSVNPFAIAARFGDRPAVRRALLARTQPLAWPARLGWWPAFVLFVLLVLGELVFQLTTTTPAFVGTTLLVYLALSFTLGLLYGEGWLQRGEVFSGLFNAWGRLGYFRFGASGRRGFAGGLDVPFTPSTSRVVFVLLLLVSINFDGLLATPQWASFERRVLGVQSADQKLFLTVSLLLLVVLVLAVFAGFATWSARIGGWAHRPIDALAGLLPSLVPIAFGYLIAHYLEYLVTNGQQLVPLAHNPGFGNGDTSYDPNPTPLPSSVYWYVSVVAIVAVHVVAVWLAHRHLSAQATNARAARRSEYPWLVAMVAYTAFSLFLIAQPLTV